jgi:deoxycytidine triphosphate deaminase
VIISGNTIKEGLRSGAIEAYRGDPEVRLKADDLTIGPNSVDVTLGDCILSPTYREGILDPRDPETMKYFPLVKVHTDRGDAAYLIMPQVVYLGYAAERFEVTKPLKVQTDWSTQVSGGAWLTPHAFLPAVQMLDGRSTVGRIGIAVHVTAGFGDVGFGGNFTLEIVNFNRIPVLLYPGMRIGQVAFHCVSPDIADQMEYSGAYKNNHVGRPVPPILGPHRF